MKNTMQKLISAVLAVMLMLSLCAGVFSVSAAEDLATVEKWNLILGDEIGAQFYVSVADSVSADAVMSVTDGYGTHNYPISAAQKDDSENYIFTANLAAAQMADTITLQLHDGENVGTAYSYNVVDYADYILSGEYGDSTKALVKAMLNYGAAAQTYFNYNTENLANAGYESTEVVEIPAVDASNMVSGKVSGISFYGASLVFQSRVAVRFYFKVTGNIADYSFSTGTPVEKDGLYYIEVADINPQDYANTISLTVNDALTVKYSPLTYISRMASSTNANMANLVKTMYVYHQAAVSYVPDPVIRGQKISPSTDLTIELGNTEVLETLSFDYKVTSGTFNISLNPDWDNSFGYFAFDANGNVDPYDGVSLETLEDGYIRVTFDIAALTKYSGDPSKALSFLYIRGAWTDANGYIENIQYTVDQTVEEPTEPPAEGEYVIAPGEDLNIDLEEENLTRVSFDYKLTSGEVFNIALMLDDWSSYYGYFAFGANGKVDPYDGVYCKALDNGYIRVIFELSELTKAVGTPNGKADFLYVRGEWTNAKGIIRNVIVNGDEKGEDIAQPDAPAEPEIPAGRGQEIKPSTDLTIELNNTENIGTLSFDYKVTSGTFNISLNPDWDNSFGYFAFDANGNVDPYAGLSLETLEDGYIRVTFDMAALTKYSGNPSKALSFLYIRGGWTDATGYIDNVQYTVEREEPTDPPATEPPVTEPPVLVFDGGEFIDDQGLNIGLNNSQAVTKMSFDYKVTSGTDFVLAFRPDWGENYYGNFVFNTTGSTDPYSGITTEALADGHVRVFVDVAALNTIQGSSPSNVLTLITVHNSWGDASGVIENIRINEAAAEPSRGQKIAPSTDLTIELGNTEELATLSFDYKVTSGTFNISLNPDWDNSFGYFAFDANGNVDPYDGVSLETLEDGYIRVTFDMASLTKYSGSPSKVLSFLYIRGGWTDATGYIDNVQYDVYEPVNVFDGGEIVAGTDLILEFNNAQPVTRMSFDYKISSGEAIVFALMPDWDNYYGYYAFGANGSIDNDSGFVTEMLADGYIRVYVDVAALNKTTGSPSNVIDILYIRGAWTSANGVIENIRFNDSAYLPSRGQQISAGKDLTLEIGNSAALNTLSFDYKVASGTFNISLNPNWDSAFGYFAFDGNGNVDPYDGVTVELLDDGYYRVTFDMNSLTKYNGAPSTAISFLYIRGAWTDATGYIDNIQFA